MRTFETLDSYLARGGKITVCPPFGGGSPLLHRGIVKSVRMSQESGWIAVLIDQNGYEARLSAINWPPGASMPKVGDAVRFDSAVNGRGRRYCTSALPAE